MKKIFIIVIASIFYFSNAFAVTLLDALNQTYKNNIQLNAERENIKISEEDVNIAKACLLYTSPSPRDRQKSRMPSSA